MPNNLSYNAWALKVVVGLGGGGVETARRFLNTYCLASAKARIVFKIVVGEKFQQLLFCFFCDQILVFNFSVYAFKQNSSEYSFTALLLFDARRKPTNPITFLLYLATQFNILCIPTSSTCVV